MKLLFTNTGTKIGTSNFKDHYPDVAQNADWASYRVVIRQVTRDYVVPYLTEAFYEELANLWQADPNLLSPKEAKLVELLQDCIAHYSIWKRAPKKNVRIADQGIQETNSSDHTNRAVSAWRYYHFYWTVMLQADNYLDDVLRLLEENFDDFPTYRDNLDQTPTKDLIIRDTVTFEQYVSINRSRRTFLKLQPYQRTVCRRLLQPVLSDQYEPLLEGIRTGNLSEDLTRLLPYVQEFVAHSSLQYALPYLSVLINDQGLQVVTSIDGMNSKQTAQKEKIINLQNRANEDAQTAYDNLKNFLFVNADAYPVWKNSDAYEIFDGDNGYPIQLGENGEGGVFI